MDEADFRPDASEATTPDRPEGRPGDDPASAPASRLAAIGAFLEREFPGARCSILRNAQDACGLSHVHAGGLPAAYVARVEALSREGRAGPYDATVTREARVVTPDLRALGDEDAPLLEAAEAADVRALWCLPIRRSDGSIAGVLAVHHAAPTTPDEATLALAETAAGLAELALVYDVEAALIRERERRSRAMEAFRHSVMNLTELVLAEADVVTFDQRLLEEAVRVIPGATTGAILRRTSPDAYRFAAAVGFDLERLRTVRMPADAVAFGHEARPARPRVVRDPPLLDALDPTDAMTLEEDGRLHDIAAVLTIPVVVGEERIAYMTLDSYDEGVPFDDEAMEMARIFAGQASSLMQRFQLEESLRRMAFEDPLTQLPNRAAFKRTLQERLDAGRTYAGHAVLFVDLDNLKPINDSLGHLAGDAVLSEVARRLRRAVKLDDGLVARLGGDEFVILLSGPTIGDDAAETAQRVLLALRDPIHVRDYDVVVGASIGIAVGPADGRTVTDLLRHADIAMYHAKQTGKGHYRFFLNEMESGARERVLLETAMRDGLDRDEFEVHFQPRVRLNDGAIVSAEALVRWRHPRRGLIPPDRFVPLAEATNLIHPLGRKVLEMACFQAAAWPAAPDGTVPNVAVNLSRHQLQRSDIVDEIAMVLQASGLAPGRFEVEVVETGAMSDVQETARTLTRLRDLGVRIALDDFGTGHSSLGWLQRLPVDVLKLDRTFIARIGDGPSLPGGTDDEAILRAILQLGHALDLTIVAEGIETVAQYRLLRGLGCDEAQGWLFAKPMPGPEMRARIEAGAVPLPPDEPRPDPL
jgi:diguanylate cyclase (GGDEF)-like protein